MYAHRHTHTSTHAYDQPSKSTSKSTQLHKAAEGLETVHKLFSPSLCCRKTKAQSATVFDVALRLMNPAESPPLGVEYHCAMVDKCGRE